MCAPSLLETHTTESSPLILCICRLVYLQGEPEAGDGEGANLNACSGGRKYPCQGFFASNTFAAALR